LTGDRLSRRDFGRLAGLAGAGLVVPGTVGAATAGAATAGTGTAGSATAGSATAGTAGNAVATRAWRVTGDALPGLGGFDAAVRDFMLDRDITRGSLAVTRDGRLVLARGYTYDYEHGHPHGSTRGTRGYEHGADTAPDTRPTSLFRIASVTKPVTAAAVLRLIQDGRLGPSDRVAGVLGLSTSADPRLADVTVLRLLQHLGGWDRSVSYDPMFNDAAIASDLGRRLPIGKDDIIEYVTARRLEHAPGTTYAYSNYGYLLLGKIIERVSGTAYARYVRNAVLTPLAIGRMRLGGTLVAAPGEVPYHSQYSGTTVLDASGAQVAGPYGSFNYENNAFNGGWLASAVDLTRFATIYDGGGPVLSEASVSRAFAPPETGVDQHGRYYGCGWHVRPTGRGRETWHNGSLPGTYALLVRRFDAVTWAVVFDQRDDPSGERYGEIGPALHEVADEIEAWPSGDLAGGYFPP
jgi:CubicO group peptidase (beta-lactamase class C family)